MKILIVGCTHGHEKIGLKIIRELEKLNIDRNILEFEIGNPEATDKDIPFIESDLNRVFPGDVSGTYEECRAFELMSKIKSADIVIDIHSTNTTDLSEDSMIIVTRYDESVKEILNIINPPKVLYMRYKGDNALISNAKIGIAFEYGKDDSDKVFYAILHDIINVLIHFNILNVNNYKTEKNTITTQVFEVYNAFDKNFIGKYVLSNNIKNFKPIKKGDIICVNDLGGEVFADEDFVPILFGEKRYTNILGFMSREIE
jgi:succinylglutamate desuccinylase